MIFYRCKNNWQHFSVFLLLKYKFYKFNSVHIIQRIFKFLWMKNLEKMLRSTLAFIRLEPMWRITLEIQLSCDDEEKNLCLSSCWENLKFVCQKGWHPTHSLRGHSYSWGESFFTELCAENLQHFLPLTVQQIRAASP